MLTTYKDQLKSPELKKELEEYLGRVKQAGGLKFWEEHVRTTRKARAFDQEMIKIEIGVTEGTEERKWLDRIMAAMQASGARRMMGTAPPGRMAELIQNYLDRNGQATGSDEF